METTSPIPGLSGMLGRTKRGLEQTVANLVGQGVHLFFLLWGGEGDHYFPGLPFCVFVLVKLGVGEEDLSHSLSF